MRKEEEEEEEPDGADESKSSGEEDAFAFRPDADEAERVVVASVDACSTSTVCERTGGGRGGESATHREAGIGSPGRDGDGRSLRLRRGLRVQGWDRPLPSV